MARFEAPQRIVGVEGDMIDFQTYIKLVHVDELVAAGNKYIKK